MPVMIKLRGDLEMSIYFTLNGYISECFNTGLSVHPLFISFVKTNYPFIEIVTTNNGGYVGKLKNPEWQKKRLRIMERDGWACTECHSTKIPLNVHHIKYDKNKEPWEVPDEYLTTLCEECHSMKRRGIALDG
jgi:hypothetical protein